MEQKNTEMDPSSAHLDSVVCSTSTEGPTIEAWSAKSDGDTSEDFITLVGVDSPLWFTIVVIEPPIGLTFVALATGESDDHCMLPHLEGQWSALFEQPYDKVSRSKGASVPSSLQGQPWVGQSDRWSTQGRPDWIATTGSWALPSVRKKAGSSRTL